MYEKWEKALWLVGYNDSRRSVDLSYTAGTAVEIDLSALKVTHK
jgi:hypothetical protein